MLAGEPCPAEKGHLLEPPGSCFAPTEAGGNGLQVTCLNEGAPGWVSSQHALCMFKAKLAVGHHQRSWFGTWIHGFESQLNYLSNCVTSDITVSFSAPQFP